MWRIVRRRLIGGAITLWLVTVAVFSLTQLLPGDPVTLSSAGAGFRGLPPERLEALRAQYHLDRPLPVQYGLWLRDVAGGDLGRSFADRRPVLEKIGRRLPLTLALNGLALLLMAGAAVPLGALAAWRPSAWAGRVGAGLGFALYAVPSFWMALLLQLVFSVKLGWLPLYGAAPPGSPDRVHPAHWVLPVICLAYGGTVYLTRFVRDNLVEQLGGEAVRAARARGVGLGRLLWRHGFGQAAVPMLTLAGFLLPALVGGSVIVETVFALPGLGRLLVDAVLERDVPVVMGLTLLSGTFTLAGITGADLAYALLDPRVRRG